jgi:hypothetical protein
LTIIAPTAPLIEEKSVEAKISAIGHGSCEVERKTSCERVKIKCDRALITVEDLL